MESQPSLSLDRLRCCYQIARDTLLAERNAAGHWTGKLSTSALSTATAVMALEMVRRSRSPLAPGGGESSAAPDFDSLISRGIAWLVQHQNADGGWGDTIKSFSSISTTMLCHAVLHAVESRESSDESQGAGCGDESSRLSTLDSRFKAQAYIDRAGGVPAVIARYGKDKTFSVPILTHCALAGLVDWRRITPLPFELACLPAKFYRWVRLPVVSYALPALIAIGQARHHFAPSRNPLVRGLRNAVTARSLLVLERIQPPNGGFLEATPLTSFVTMSLAGIGLADHPVARRGIDFIVKSVRPDGSWPIDTNLATWVTTLSINALGDDLPADAAPPLLDWLLKQQYREVHPYTNADPGGWAWTDLPGGVPDGDDTPGAVLALLRLEAGCETIEDRGVTQDAVQLAVRWLLDLPNRDGGWPTFCRGWGNLPFDRSSLDITAHVVRTLQAFMENQCVRIRGEHSDDPPVCVTDLCILSLLKVIRLSQCGFQFLTRSQRSDGSWLPLWFGNQHCPNDENKTYGTARVLAAYRDCRRMDDPAAQRGLAWLRANQNEDGGWGGAKGTPSSVEETALAVEMLASADQLAARVAGVERSKPPEPRAGGSLRSTPATHPRLPSPSGRGVGGEGASRDAGPESLRDDRTTRPHPGPLPKGEETVDTITTSTIFSPETTRGLTWLCEAVETGKYREASPIGFYFAKLWYFEKLYPIIFTVAALGRAVRPK